VLAAGFPFIKFQMDYYDELVSKSGQPNNGMIQVGLESPSGFEISSKS
jgi:hypothetical protein